MRQYQETENGYFTFGGMSIPNVVGNRHYNKLLTELGKGESTILPYTAPVVSDNDLLDIQIKVLEDTQTLRRLREAILKPAGKLWLQDVEDQIETLRSQKV